MTSVVYQVFVRSGTFRVVLQFRIVFWFRYLGQVQLFGPTVYCRHIILSATSLPPPDPVAAGRRTETDRGFVRSSVDQLQAEAAFAAVQCQSSSAPGTVDYRNYVFSRIVIECLYVCRSPG